MADNSDDGSVLVLVLIVKIGSFVFPTRAAVPPERMNSHNTRYRRIA
jgi:hypothetical protein